MSDKNVQTKIKDVLAGALDAVDGRGNPDHPTRLRAAELLLRSERARDAAEPEGDGKVVIKWAE